MAIFTNHNRLATLVILIFYFEISIISVISAAEEISSFSYKWFGKDSSLEENINFYGDSKVVDGGSAIRLTKGVSLSWGRVMYKKPITTFEGKEKNFVSFSTSFSFSISNESGDGLAFVMVPSGFNLSMFVNNHSSFGFPMNYANNETEFDTPKDFKYSNLSGSHVGIDVGSLVLAKIKNLSPVGNMKLSNGQKLHCWIDYEASSKRIEVWVRESGMPKPVDPTISSSIDLSKLRKNEKIFVGLSSSNGNSSQTCNVYSWSFKLRHFPNSMHSQPLDPNETLKPQQKKPLVVRRKSDCPLRMPRALVLGVVCGTLGAILIVYLWTICGSRRTRVVVPEESVVKTVDLKSKKIEIAVVDKSDEENKK